MICFDFLSYLFSGKASPAIPPKQKSGLIHSSSDEDILNSSGPQTSFTLKETRPGDESITELSSQGDSVPLLPPKVGKNLLLLS